MRILLAIEPGASIGALATREAATGIFCDSVPAEEVQAYLEAYAYDVVVLAGSCMAPLLRRLRRGNMMLPVLVLGEMDGKGRATLLDLGADDVVAPGCSAVELTARLRALLRRSAAQASSDLHAGAATLRLGRMELVVHGQALTLTPKEYAILEPLFLRKGMVLSKASIVDQVYGAVDGPAVRSLDVIVCKLRKKLAARGAPDLVGTVWGSGLVLHDLPAAPRDGASLAA
ncbi:Response regulator transcription factor [Rhodovastum atsumiense]|nr:response regulator transcription factor [Rhodovastum atsumiense]CAH2603611.1 Response regulator transcription factor [Rhodovastum atsumiense]